MIQRMIIDYGVSLLHLHKIVEGLYFHFSLSVCVCVCLSVRLSVCLSVSTLAGQPLDQF